MESLLPQVVTDSSKAPISRFESVVIAFLKNFESKLTGKEYARICREFFSFVGPHITDISNLTREHIIAYKDFLAKRGQSNKTRLKKLSAISSLCKYLAHEGMIERDLTYGVRRPRTRNKRETAAFTEEEVKRIFESLNPRSKSHFFHRAILAVGFFTGLRSAEIRNLKIADFTTRNGCQILRTVIKGDKSHEVPLNDFVVLCLSHHIERRRAAGFCVSPADWLFPRMNPPENRPISAQYLRKMLHQKMKAAGIIVDPGLRYSPHSMRATLATHLLNTICEPLEDVQKLLGHSDPRTTQGYRKREKDLKDSPAFKADFGVGI